LKKALPNNSFLPMKKSGLGIAATSRGGSFNDR
jgi:hypothetical protein